MMTRRAAVYARISRDDEGTGANVDNQISDCRARAARDGLTVVEVYRDDDISASTIATAERPAFGQMMSDAREGRFDVILAYSNSRLTRRPLELEGLIQHHERYGTQFRTVVSGDDNLATADGRMVARIKASVDAGEAERTAERVRRKMRQLAEDGRYVGRRPFGWDFTGAGVTQRLVVNDAEAAVVRECVDRVLAGDALWKIVRDLNARGVPTSTGGPWATQVLRRMLLRWMNAGLRQHQPRRRGKPVGPVALYPGQWEPIIDRETHERVVALLTDPGRRKNNRGTEVKYLLTSLAFCGVCGGHVVGTAEFTYTLANGRERHYPHAYKCPAAGCHGVQRRMADVDDLVERVVLGVLERDGVRLLGGDPAAAEAARARIGGLEAKLALAADQFADDAITADQLARITERVRPQLDAERSRLTRSQPSGTLGEYAGPGVRDAWERADVETRRAVIRATGVRVTILQVGPGNGRQFDPESVTIEWRQ